MRSYAGEALLQYLTYSGIMLGHLGIWLNVFRPWVYWAPYGYLKRLAPWALVLGFPGSAVCFTSLLLQLFYAPTGEQFFVDEQVHIQWMRITISGLPVAVASSMFIVFVHRWVQAQSWAEEVAVLQRWEVLLLRAKAYGLAALSQIFNRMIRSHARQMWWAGRLTIYGEKK